ncbi:SHRM2 protein, partial [Atractosteus spatula]|nr:SHRM2 protein [Atractosteus spatula]
MDALDPRSDPRLTGKDHRAAPGIFHQDAEILGAAEPRDGDGEAGRLVKALLTGGAPWGFTLKGGREHQEPLLITKVEEGSKAAAVKLQVGDEIVAINEVPLSGYRQEAICLVKGSHKTLSLVVKSVFLTACALALRVCRELSRGRRFLVRIIKGQPETVLDFKGAPQWQRRRIRPGNPTVVSLAKLCAWVRRDTRPPSLDESVSFLRPRSSESPQPPGRGQCPVAEPVEAGSGGGVWLGCETRGLPLQGWKMKMVDIVAQKMPSESDVHVARSFLTKILRSSMRKSRFKGRNEPVSRPHSWHSTKFTENQSEAAKTQLTPTTVWHTRYDASSSSHDLTGSWDQPNLRRASDQFSSLGSMDSLEHSSHPYPPGRLSPAKSNTSIDHLGGSGHGNKRDSAYSSFSTSSSTPDYTLSKSNAASTENMLHKVGQWDAGRHSNGRHSQSLSDDRQGYLQLPAGTGGRESPRTDEQPGSRYSSSGRSSFGPVWHIPEKKKRSPSPPPPPPPVRSDSFAATKVHEKGLAVPYSETAETPSYPHNLQKPQARSGDWVSAELSESQQKAYRANERGHEARRNYNPSPKNETLPPYISLDSYNNNHQHYNQAQVRTSSTSLSSPPMDQNMEGTGHSRYYCITARQPAQTVSQASLVKVEGWKGSTGIESISAAVQDTPAVKSNVEDRGGHKRNNVYNMEVNYMSYPPNKHDDLKKYGGIQQTDQQKELWLTEGEEKISPQKTPMLHSLAQESLSTAGNPSEPQSGCARQETVDPLTAKQVRRSDRYATTLRNEIQIKRAQLQKSKSSATLTGPSEAEEDAEVWKSESTESSTSSSDGSFSSTYKDHLKEAQARVLRATSFKRRDLEPVLLELPVPDALPTYSSSALARKEVNPALSSSEVPRSRASSATGSGAAQVSRIGGRKRFTAEQKVRSYSEPDKINEVGVTKTHSYPDKATSFADRCKFFEGTSKSAFPKPLSRPALQSSCEEHGEGRLSRKSHHSEPEESWHEQRSRAASLGYGCSLGALEEDQRGYNVRAKATERYIMLEQQRLGTFAEYEATWNEQRKLSEARPSGRYHSADNILDSGMEEKISYIHERSRSSPSADFHGQNVPVQGRKKEDYSQRQQNPSGCKNSDAEPPSTSWLFKARFRRRFLLSTEHLNVQYNLKTVMCELQRNPVNCTQTFWPFLACLFFQLSKRPVNDQAQELKPSSTGWQPPPEQAGQGDLENRDGAVALGGERSPPAPDNGDVNEAPPARSRHQAATDSSVGSHSAGPDHPAANPAAAPSSKKKGPVPQRPPPPKLDKYRRQETTSSLSDSSESLLGSQSSRAVGPRSPGAPLHTQTQLAAGPEEEQGAAERGSLAKLEPAPPPPSSPSSSKSAGFFRPSMDGPRTPSPQFAPQRLTDRPPVSIQDEAPSRIEKVMDNNTTVKMVPIKIVHAESSSEKESRQYLLHSVAPAGSAEEQGDPQVKTLGSSEESYSLFCAYTRQRAEGPGEAGAEDPKDSPSAAQAASNGVRSAPDRTDEDKKTEELAREIVDKDRSLADILDPGSKLKTTMDLMEGIFPKEDQLLEGAQQRRKPVPKQGSPKSAEEKKEDELASVVPLGTSSTYYSTSAPKAELLIKMKDMQEQIEEQDSEDELDNDLSQKKQELISSIGRKLQVLREARESLLEDVQANNALGDEVEALVQRVCKPNEVDKFRMFVGDLDKVVSLLLSLSGRLARVENALDILSHQRSCFLSRQRILTEKRKLLIRQHDDAKELKENLDRRERAVFAILASYLDEDSLADYEHFVKMKSALIIEQRKLEDKIKLGEEQLKCLTDSLPLDHRAPF